MENKLLVTGCQKIITLRPLLGAPFTMREQLVKSIKAFPGAREELLKH